MFCRQSSAAKAARKAATEAGKKKPAAGETVATGEEAEARWQWWRHCS
jgi:hypothetical protein